MTTTTNSNEKLYFKYLLKHKYFIHDKDIFSNSDIKNVYEYIKDYYNSYNSLPILTNIYEKVNIKREIINILMDLDELDKLDLNWLASSFKEYSLKRNVDITIAKMIDDARNGNYESVIKKLNVDVSIDDECDEEENVDEFLSISDDIYNNLPEVLQNLTKNYNGKEKDVLLTSILSCVSIYFSNVKGTYFKGSEVYNNIYTFIVGDSGIGKSIMKNAKILTNVLNKSGIDKYIYEKNRYNSLNKEEKLQIEPPVEHLYVSGADATQQALMKYMNNNNGKFLIFATEAEALTAKSKDVNGDFTLIIRESIQNDTFTKILKTEEAMIIDKPKLNICVSGTYDQIQKIIGKDGSDNGTFNRFLYYYWNEVNRKVDNPFSNGDGSDIFYSVGEKIYEFYDQYLRFENKFKFILSEKQQEIFFSKLSKNHGDFLSFFDENVADAIVKRHYLFAYKLMITMSCLRLFDDFNKIELFDNFKIEDNITINDIDFNNVLKIIDVYLDHSLKLSNGYKSKKVEIITKPWKLEFWESVGKTFKRQTLINSCLKNGKSEKTADRLIKKWKDDGIIIKDGYDLVKVDQNEKKIDDFLK